jgi:hypothetical protein
VFAYLSLYVCGLPPTHASTPPSWWWWWCCCSTDEGRSLSTELERLRGERPSKRQRTEGGEAELEALTRRLEEAKVELGEVEREDREMVQKRGRRAKA